MKPHHSNWLALANWILGVGVIALVSWLAHLLVTDPAFRLALASWGTLKDLLVVAAAGAVITLFFILINKGTEKMIDHGKHGTHRSEKPDSVSSVSSVVNPFPNPFNQNENTKL